MIKLVALDVDGTLINRDLQIPAVTRQAIFSAKSRGVQVTIVTGRMYQSAAPYARDLGLEGPLVAYNGALMQEYPSGRTIYHEPLPLEMCKAVAALCESRGYHLQAYVNDELYVPDMGPRTQQYTDIARVKAHPVGSLFLWLNKPSTKLLIVNDPERIPVIQQEVRDLLGPAAHVVPSYPMFLEIVSARASKGAALEAVARSMGLTASEVMAVGDAMNDLPMLAWAGTSFAMGHAPEAVRQAATHVTRAGPGDGVAEALERMGLA